MAEEISRTARYRRYGQKNKNKCMPPFFSNERVHATQFVFSRCNKHVRTHHVLVPQDLLQHSQGVY